MRRFVFAAILILVLSGVAVAEVDAGLIPIQDAEVPFRLFPTSNMWTFLMLDTTDGRIWQLQYDINGDNRGTIPLSELQLTEAEGQFPGRFTLYPTSNIYTFIMLDQYDGRTWQVQWSQDQETRFIIPIF